MPLCTAAPSDIKREHFLELGEFCVDDISLRDIESDGKRRLLASDEVAHYYVDSVEQFAVVESAHETVDVLYRASFAVCGPEHAESVGELGLQDEEAFAAFISGFVASEDNLYSHSLTKVAVLDDGSASGRVVGMMNGYDGAQYEDLKKAVADRFDKEFPGSGEKFRGVSETGAGEFYLDSAGVDPQMRSMGIGSMLFEAMFARAKSEGFGTVGLIVDEDKPKAEALYRRLGFSVVGEKDFLGHKMKHMQKSI